MEKYFKIIPILFFIFNCASSPQRQILTPDLEPEFDISGVITNLPPEVMKEGLSLEVRFFDCPDAKFGKYNSDSGTYPYQKEDCRIKYSQEEFRLEKMNFTIRPKTLQAWTHASVQLKGIEKIRGKYSSGENPYWFTKEDSKKQKIQFSYNFVSTENPIPDKDQMKLAEKFSPIIVLKKDKKFIPTNLAKYAKSFEKKEKKKKSDSLLYGHDYALKDEYLELDESLYGKGETHLYFHLRYADTFVSGTSEKALPGFRDNFNYSYRKGNGDMVISYYLWYDYNEGPSGLGNRHEGDFESFAVLVDAKGNPLRFMVTGHNHVMLDTAWNNINSYDNHPIIYIAHGRGDADGGNPTSPYGGFEVGLEAGNPLFNALANPKDIFPELGGDAQVILPSGLEQKDLKSLRIGPGEWIDKEKTKYVDASHLVTRKIGRLVKWEEPAWINETAVLDPDKNHYVSEEDAFFMNWNARIGRHPETSLKVFQLAQYGKSPVNPPFKMNEEQHFTLEKPRTDRCEKARVGDYCPRFIGDSKTPQLRK